MNDKDALKPGVVCKWQSALKKFYFVKHWNYHVCTSLVARGFDKVTHVALSLKLRAWGKFFTLSHGNNVLVRYSIWVGIVQILQAIHTHTDTFIQNKVLDSSADKEVKEELQIPIAAIPCGPRMIGQISPFMLISPFMDAFREDSVFTETMRMDLCGSAVFSSIAHLPSFILTLNYLWFSLAYMLCFSVRWAALLW